MKGVRIVLADDHVLVRTGIKMVLQGIDGVEVVGEARTGRDAVEEAAKLRPDLIVMDISMPELNGIEATRQICAELPQTKVLALSMHRDGFTCGRFSGRVPAATC